MTTRDEMNHVLALVRKIESRGWTLTLPGIFVRVEIGTRQRKKYGFSSDARFDFATLEQAAGFVEGFSTCEQYETLAREAKATLVSAPSSTKAPRARKTKKPRHSYDASERCPTCYPRKCVHAVVKLKKLR